jgi:hypothetical protein
MYYIVHCTVCKNIKNIIKGVRYSKLCLASPTPPLYK